jgi:ferrous iron transport protein B
LEFLKRAGTIILAISILVWALSRLPSGEVESSLLAGLGHLLAPVGALMGLDWRMMVALLTSFIAKENSIAALGILLGTGESGAQLTGLLSSTLAPAAGLAFLTVQMLFIPCAATVATVKQETDSWKWTGFSVGILLIVSFLVAVGVYQLALLVGV